MFVRVARDAPEARADTSQNALRGRRTVHLSGLRVYPAMFDNFQMQIRDGTVL
jgi:hypothetical protein